MACNLSTTQTAACASGIGKLDNPVELLQVIAELSCEIAAAGGGGGSSGATVGTGSPQGVVTANPGAFYWDTTGKSLWIKDTGTATSSGWYQLL